MTMQEKLPKRFEIYKIQHRLVKQGKWLEIDSPLKKVKSNWHFSSWDAFEGMRLFGKNPKESDDTYKVFCSTSQNGWFQLKHAKAALKRLVANNEKGKFDSTHQGRKTRKCRYEFRIVKVIYHSDIVLVEF